MAGAVRASDEGWPAWDDPALTVASDGPRTARYRLAQSRWRHTVLALPPGTSARGQTVGSMLAPDAPVAAQWLTGHIASRAEQRLTGSRAGDAPIEPNRARRNLLSSLPMCMNIFCQFDAFRDAAAACLSEALPWPIDTIRDVRIEYAPVLAAAALGDATAFDAFVEFTGPDGPGFLAVETKYIEPLSPTEYTSTRYNATTDDPNGWFHPGVDEQASHRETNQLWRNTMLAQLAAADHPGDGHVVVLSLDEDEHANAAVTGLGAVLREPGRRLHHLSLQTLAAAAATQPDLEAWAALFTARYL